MLQVRWVGGLLAKLDTYIRQISSSGWGGIVGQATFIGLVNCNRGTEDNLDIF